MPKQSAAKDAEELLDNLKNVFESFNTTFANARSAEAEAEAKEAQKAKQAKAMVEAMYL